MGSQWPRFSWQCAFCGHHALPSALKQHEFAVTGFGFRRRKPTLGADKTRITLFIGTATSTFFTIGHSTRTIVEFADLLREADVDLVVDVRSMPRSRTNPQFNEQTFPQALALSHIGYKHIAELGGHRGKIDLSEPSPNAYWRVRGFRNYADYALTEPFAVGFARLRDRGSRQRCAIMCAEAVWWRCHRRIIADYLLAAGEDVRHIIGPRHIDEASLTPSAIVLNDGTIIYPAECSEVE